MRRFMLPHTAVAGIALSLLSGCLQAPLVEPCLEAAFRSSNAQALRTCEDAARADPHRIDVLLALGRLRMERQEYALAVPVFRSLTHLAPQRIEPHLSLAYALTRSLHDPLGSPELLHSVETAVTLDPSTSKHALRIARLHVSLWTSRSATEQRSYIERHVGSAQRTTSYHLFSTARALLSLAARQGESEAAARLHELDLLEAEVQQEIVKARHRSRQRQA